MDEPAFLDKHTCWAAREISHAIGGERGCNFSSYLLGSRMLVCSLVASCSHHQTLATVNYPPPPDYRSMFFTCTMPCIDIRRRLLPPSRRHAPARVPMACGLKNFSLKSVGLLIHDCLFFCLPSHYYPWSAYLQTKTYPSFFSETQILSMKEFRYFSLYEN